MSVEGIFIEIKFKITLMEVFVAIKNDRLLKRLIP
jgi:hypothetical protein